jgi:hypothetical protein
MILVVSYYSYYVFRKANWAKVIGINRLDFMTSMAHRRNEKTNSEINSKLRRFAGLAPQSPKSLVESCCKSISYEA